MPKIIRIDDIGASSKQFNQYGRTLLKFRGIPIFYFPFAHWSFFKRIPPFQGWGPYEELTVEEWEPYLRFFREHRIRPVIGITAAWVTESGALIPFPEKFPTVAARLRQSLKAGEIEIANHGLTHCVVGQHLPKRFGSNRDAHREFWPTLPAALHKDHIIRSQTILEGYFGQKVTIFIPPGNVWGSHTYRALRGTSITTVTCNRPMLDSQETMEGIDFQDDHDTLVLHDRDLKKHSVAWLKHKLNLT